MRKENNSQDALLLSVCLITYNHAKYIEKAIDGVLMQETNFNWELIIADDFSSDGTRDIIKKYYQKYPDLIKLILQDKNVGPGNNWLDLLRAPRGKYIAYFEGDDYWTDPLKLQKQVNFLEANTEYSMVCHDALVVNEMTGTSKNFFTSMHEKRICSTKDVFETHFCPTASMLFRNHLLSINDLSSEARAGDMMLTLLLSLKGLLYRMNDVMCVYRKTESGLTEVNRRNWESSLINRIGLLNHFNKVSRYKYNKYIRIEILIMKSTIDFSKAKSKYGKTMIKVRRKILFEIKKRIFS